MRLIAFALKSVVFGAAVKYRLLPIGLIVWQMLYKSKWEKHNKTQTTYFKIMLCDESKPVTDTSSHIVVHMTYTDILLQ